MSEAAFAALLRGIVGRNLQYQLAFLDGLVLRELDELRHAGIEDGPIESRLCRRAIGQVLARGFVLLGFRRSRHALEIEFLKADDARVRLHQSPAGFVIEVSPDVPDLEPVR